MVGITRRTLLGSAVSLVPAAAFSAPTAWQIITH